MPMAVIQHELARLHAIGIDDVFGVPVNYAFPVNDAICDYPPDRVLLALRTPRQSIAAIWRQVCAAAAAHSWPAPSYATVHAVVRALDPGLVTLAHEGSKAYKEAFDLLYRREAGGPNASRHRRGR